MMKFVGTKSIFLILISLSLLVSSYIHAEMTAFGERVDSKSTPDSPLSALPEFPSFAPSPTPSPILQVHPSPSPQATSPSNKKDSGAKPSKPAPPPRPKPTPTPPPVKLFERTVETGQRGQPEIHFFLRLPEGHTPEHPTAKGVLAFCTWQHQDESLRAALRNEKSTLVQYAKKNNLALLTWNTAILWKSRKSFEQLNPR